MKESNGRIFIYFLHYSLSFVYIFKGILLQQFRKQNEKNITRVYHYSYFCVFPPIPPKSVYVVALTTTMHTNNYYVEWHSAFFTHF